MRYEGRIQRIVFCAAGRSTIIVGTAAVRTATGTIRTTLTGTTVFVWRFLTSLFAPAGNAKRSRLFCRGFFDGWVMSWLTLHYEVGQIYKNPASYSAQEPTRDIFQTKHSEPFDSERSITIYQLLLLLFHVPIRIPRHIHGGNLLARLQLDDVVALACRAFADSDR